MFKIKLIKPTLDIPLADVNVSVKHTKNFHKKKHLIKKVILSKTDPHEIIHGEQAVKKQTPNYLHRPTVDYDIFTPTPYEDATETEKALDKRFGGNFFKVVSGQHQGTYRVVAYANNESYADYTKPEEKIPFKTIDGKKYATLEFMQKKAKETVNNPFSSFRHSKDIDTINRIKIVKNSRR